MKHWISHNPLLALSIATAIIGSIVWALTANAPTI